MGTTCRKKRKLNIRTRRKRVNFYFYYLRARKGKKKRNNNNHLNLNRFHCFSLYIYITNSSRIQFSSSLSSYPKNNIVRLICKSSLSLSRLWVFFELEFVLICVLERNRNSKYVTVPDDCFAFLFFICCESGISDYRWMFWLKYAGMEFYWRNSFVIGVKCWYQMLFCVFVLEYFLSWDRESTISDGFRVLDLWTVVIGIMS